MRLALLAGTGQFIHSERLGVANGCTARVTVAMGACERLKLLQLKTGIVQRAASAAGTRFVYHSSVPTRS